MTPDITAVAIAVGIARDKAASESAEARRVAELSWRERTHEVYLKIRQIAQRDEAARVLAQRKAIARDNAITFGLTVFCFGFLFCAVIGFLTICHAVLSWMFAW